MLLIGVGLAYGGAGHAAQDESPHTQAVSAAADLKTAVGILVQAGDSSATGADFFQRAAQKTINALVGKQGTAYRATAGDPASGVGAIGHMTALLHLPGKPAWSHTVRGAWVNTTVAVSTLRHALEEDDLDSFQSDMSQALTSLEIALGRASEPGTLGGLKGALANTELGVPAGATRLSGCTDATEAPAYGVTGGYLAFYAAPVNPRGDVALPQVFGERKITMKDSFVVIRTAAASKVTKLCRQMENEMPRATPAASTKPKSAARPETTPNPKTGQASGEAPEAVPAAANSVSSDSSLPTLYEKSQASRGEPLYEKNCSSCHGSDTQGASAPANAGTAFLKNANELGWSVSDMRYLVVNTMPLDNPSSLSPKEYAQVMAFLLASSCYPAGDTPFPTDDAPRLKKASLAPLESVHADKPRLGLCTVP